MKTYILAFIVTSETDRQVEEIAKFDDLKVAQKEFKEKVKKQPRLKTYEHKGEVTESIVLELWENDEHQEDVMQQVIYTEQNIDRTKGLKRNSYENSERINSRRVRRTKR